MPFYDHLRFSREAPLTNRPRRGGFPGVRPPEHPREHGKELGQSLADFRQAAATANIEGFDDRLLLKVLVRDDVMAPDLDAIPGVQLVSQEDKSIILAFANQEGLAEFETRLASLARDGKAKRADILYALQSFDHWTADDRQGAALRQRGFPESAKFVLDVELWPQERADRRDLMLVKFLEWLAGEGIERLDDLKQPSLVMVRVRCDRSQAKDRLLCHRDVRTVDLPARIGVSVRVLRADLATLPAPRSPPESAPGIAVLDSGLTTGHPLLGPAVGDAQGYLEPLRQPDDSGTWHGTSVAGLALYGNVEECIARGRFVPELRLYAGKVFENGGRDDAKFVEKAVEEAAQDLYERYECRVFNLSYGDLNKVYDGRHVRGLAYTLDRLTRELGVLFVVPTGNLATQDLPENLRTNYPEYLLAEPSRLLDPAPALNVLTVGGLAFNTATHAAQRFPDHIEDLPVAQRGQPFPLTRSGPTINGAIKPDLVENAGNVAVMRSGGRLRFDGLGVVSTFGDFVGGQLFAENIGTSFAAPLVAHRAARLLAEVPNASANLLRALLAAHARWPQSSCDLFASRGKSESKADTLRVLGYGQIDEASLYRSVGQTVTLLAEDQIGKDICHFYELPIPESYWSGRQRNREISVALAYSPEVRTTRLEYRMSRIWFNLVLAESLEEVEKAFERNREEGMGEHSNGRWLTNEDRKKGTLQVSRWSFKQTSHMKKRLFVVVTRQDLSWSRVGEGSEPYSLVIVLADRENASINLYSQVEQRLALRAQARARARS